MRFKDWFLKETMTSTGDIAGFSRMTLPLVTRTWAPEIVSDMDVKGYPKNKKIKSQSQVKESQACCRDQDSSNCKDCGRHTKA